MFLIGDMIGLGLSARRFIDHWPVMKAEYDAISTPDMYVKVSKHTGEVQRPAMRMADLVPGFSLEAPVLSFQRRALFHAMLYHQLQKLRIDVVFSKQAVRYYEVAADDGQPAKGGVEFADGQSAEADLVIAADGIKSSSQEFVNGGTVQGQSFGTAIYRAALPIDIAMRDLLVKEHFGLVDGKHAMVSAMLGYVVHVKISLGPFYFILICFE